MRVISGSLKGQIFKSPGKKSIHPMSDKMRNAVFNILGDISGKTVLDLYSGSGALSYEAVSRGAYSVTSIENNLSAQKIIAENKSKLKITENLKLIKASVGSWSINNLDKTFDIVIADPPYNFFKKSIVETASKHVTRNGILVISQPVKDQLDISGLKKVAIKNYGDSNLAIYTKIS